MMTGYLWRSLVLILLGFGVFSLLAGGLGVLLWLVARQWQPYVPAITLLAFAAGWPLAYQVWKRHQPSD
jgi:hypothetical protein